MDTGTVQTEDGTSAAILRAAERLFAERGFEVSLREIGRSAGQRNNSAVQYHFGTRDRLIEALYAYRMVPINRRRLALIEEACADGRKLNLEQIIDLGIQPLAEHVLAHRGSSSYARFVARLVLSGDSLVPTGRDFTEGLRLLSVLSKDVMPELTEEREFLLALFTATAMANLELRCEDRSFTDEQAREVLAELRTAAIAMITAPRAG